MLFQNTGDDHFACRHATAPTLTPSAKITFVQLNWAIKNLISSQCQMMADDLADFAVEQGCRIGMDT
ncbi:Uncharacterised protein [Helicobacter pametensis]|nr:Uncharacterised protein [Helicobacter pametensis]